MLHSLQDWLVDWADSSVGPAMLALFSAAEAIFFPIPPDPLLIALALRNPDDALLLAGLTTVASTGGGVIGHLLGRRVGRPILRRFHSRQVERVEELFVRHGFWAIVLAGLTPLPYKLFTVAAGVFDVPRLPFVLASIVGRGLRFGGIGVLIFFWGDRFQQFLDERFDLIMLSMGALLLVAVAVWAVWARRNGRLAAGG
jgi:undecaprenyl-diphosphatase